MSPGIGIERGFFGKRTSGRKGDMSFISTRSNRIPKHRACHGGNSAGYSLLEVLFASLLLLVVAVSILPLFTRALQSNLAGGRASNMTNFAASDLEAANQRTINHSQYDLEGQQVLSLGEAFWNLVVDGTGSNSSIGDEKWQADDTGSGVFVWKRSTKVRKYSISDITPLVQPDGTTLSALGHPYKYDSPLSLDDSSVHLSEFRVTIRPNQDNLPAATGRRLTVGHFRAY